MMALLLTTIFPLMPAEAHAWIPGPLIALADAAVRGLLVAAFVWVGLRPLAKRNVVAQKTAWGLVLAGAFLMPFAVPWAARLTWLPPQATLMVPVHTWWQTAAPAVTPAVHQTPKVELSSANPTVTRATSSSLRAASSAQPGTMISSPASFQADRFPAPTISNSFEGGSPSSSGRVIPSTKYVLPLSDAAWLVYGAVCAILLLRLFYGLGAALGLWQSAEPVRLEPSYLAAGLRLRCSRKVSSPVTVGSGIVLPADYDEWGIEKLRIVLAHERSHVRQGDFYLQALAGVYGAIFWFSPLGWWLKRRLSDLSEAISDRAGLEEAVSYASYAQILLEFAALPRRTQIGVAMARSGSIAQRIERLLNENSFRQAFAGGRRRLVAVLLMVFATLFASTALIRVEAARMTQQPITPVGPITGQSHPESAPDRASELAPRPAKTPAAAAEAQAPAQAPQAPSVLAPAPQAAPAAVPAPESVDADTLNDNDNQDTTTSAQCRGTTVSHSYVHSSTGHGYSYSYTSDGDSYALVSSKDQHARFSGEWHNSDIDKARSVAHGDFLWFSRDGKSYVVDDPQTIAQIQAMYKPMEDLGRQQEELGKRQEELGRQQAELGKKQEEASIPTPDISHEMTDLNAAVAKLQAKQNATITVQQLAELQGKIGELEGKLGSLQGEIGAEQGELGRQQGDLGRQQGELGRQQGRLGEQQGRLARQADAKVRFIIDQSLKDGKARPVQ